MANVSDPALAQAYQDVRNDKTGITWALLGYEPGTNKIVVQSTGSGGFQELKSKFDDTQRQYAYVRFTTGDEESKRTKFVFISWCGEKVKALQKAQMSVHKADVKSIFKEYALEQHFTSQADLDEEKIRAAVVKAGGANYNGQNQA